MLHDGNCPYTVFALGEPGKIIPEEKNLSPAAAGDFALAGLFARKGIEGALALSSLKSGRTNCARCRAGEPAVCCGIDIQDSQHPNRLTCDLNAKGL
jgi:hypothetical protein